MIDFKEATWDKVSEVTGCQQEALDCFLAFLERSDQVINKSYLGNA